MMKTNLPLPSMRRQRGAVLAISMIFLIIVTLIGVYAANTATMDVRMARNMQAHMESEHAAEAGLNAALETLAPATGDVLFTSVATPTALSTGALLDNLNTGASSVTVSIAYMGRSLVPDTQSPTGQAGGNSTTVGFHLHRVVSAHETADANTSVGVRVKQAILE
ncbi:pilus assembly PilX family protein [Hydrogenophaga atypica]|uniref:PilX N-terminal domain-containing pilus assembly protein n=1 Tax=Hydrogenophaga atypica TaxID=249409 RepID=A0ABW2QF05_9BURK